MNMLHFAGGIGLMCLPACDTTPLRDAFALRNVDPITTDAAALRVAVAVPETIQLRPGSVQMKGVLTPEGGEPQAHSFDLVAVPTGPDLQQAAADQPDGVLLHGFRIDPVDLNAFETFRAAVRAAKEGKGQGALTVDPGLCHTGAAPPNPLPMSIYLKTAELDRFVTLSRIDNLRLELSRAELNELAPPCQ